MAIKQPVAPIINEYTNISFNFFMAFIIKIYQIMPLYQQTHNFDLIIFRRINARVKKY